MTAIYSWLQLHNMHLDNHKNSDFMNGGARIVRDGDRIVPGKVRPGIKYRKTPDIDQSLDAEAKQFHLMVNRANEAENTREKPIGVIT